MRMWMVPVEYMCNKHLLGEHVEIHMFVGSINNGQSVDGYIANDLLEPLSLRLRHQEIVKEMIGRGYSHKQELPPISAAVLGAKLYHTINVSKSVNDLKSRCKSCAKRMPKWWLTRLEDEIHET